ncbi:MAG TPA: FecR domain-containing protein [Gemmatimonadaceae bacterium]|nr:FecR domain-containing protein [Gemmatimonadaceae bacterium]
MRIDDEGGMETLPHDDPVWTALVRFSRTPLSAEDAAELERWVADDPMRRDMVRAVQRLGAMARQRPPRRRSVAAWERVRARMADGEPPRALGPATEIGLHRAPSRRRMLVAIAGLAASMVAAVAQRERIASTIEEWLAAAAPQREVATRVGERRTVHLDDGTTVTLGPLSRLRYGRLAGARRRTVQLEGEAYFAVAPDTTHPFSVLARFAAVQVVGTAFDVRAYPGDSVVQVLTTHGRVALRSRDAVARGGALVERGERGTVNPSGYVHVGTADVARGTAWTSGRLNYQLVPLDALLRDLTRWYDLDFTVADSSLARVRVTITLDGATAGDAVEQLAAALQVPYRRIGRAVILGAR